MSTNHQIQVEQAVAKIEKDAHNHQGSSAFLHELDTLRRADAATKGQYGKDFTKIKAELHGVLPNLDLVATGNGQGAFLGVNGTSGSVTTQDHGTSFVYDKQGHVVKYSTDGGKDVFKYSQETGQYQEYKNGTAKGKPFEAAINVSQGHEVITNADGSTTSYTGGTQINRNLDGHVTAEISPNGTTTNFKYDKNGNLTEMKVLDGGNKTHDYILQTDGQYKGLFLDSKSKKIDPVIVNVTDSNGTTTVTQADGTSKSNGALGEVISRDAQGISNIKYGNGDNANHFQYGTDGSVTSFEVKGKDGKVTTYTSSPSESGSVVAVAEQGQQAHLIKGNIVISPDGVIDVGDNSNTANPANRIQYNLGGAVVNSGPDGPTAIINNKGQESTYGYTNGVLSSVGNAYGHNMKLEGGQWREQTATDPPQWVATTIVPSWDANQHLTFTNPDGTATHYWPGGSSYQTAPDNVAQTGTDQTGSGQTGADQPGTGQTGTGQTGGDQPGTGQNGTGQTGGDQPGTGQTGTGQTGGDQPPSAGDPSKIFKTLGTDVGQLKPIIAQDLAQLKGLPGYDKVKAPLEADFAKLSRTAASDALGLLKDTSNPTALKQALQTDETSLTLEVGSDLGSIEATSPQIGNQLVTDGTKLKSVLENDFSQLKPEVEGAVQEFESAAHGAPPGTKPDIFSMLGADYAQFGSTLSKDEAQLEADPNFQAVKSSIQTAFAQLRKDAASGNAIKLVTDLWKDGNASETSPQLKAAFSKDIGPLWTELEEDFVQVAPALKSDYEQFVAARKAATPTTGES